MGRLPEPPARRLDGEANQEEMYIPIAGSGHLRADETTVELQPGMMVRVGPEQLRKIVPGPGALV